MTPKTRADRIDEALERKSNYSPGLTIAQALDDETILRDAARALSRLLREMPEECPHDEDCPDYGDGHNALRAKVLSLIGEGE